MPLVEPDPTTDPVMHVRWRLCRSVAEALADDVPVAKLAEHTGISALALRKMAAEYRNG